MPTKLTSPRALLVLPHLIWYAKMRMTVTYKELANKVGVHHRTIPWLLGNIRDTICKPRNLPLINSIVVNKKTKEPGHNYLPEGTDPEENKRELESLQAQVFEYTTWDDLLLELGIQSIPAEVPNLDKEAREYNEIMARQGGEGGEQDEHRRLKDLIASRPQLINISAMQQADTEHLFLSADRCDILIELFGNSAAIVEIKVRQRGELVKGIYQLVKYRALLEAERTHGGTYPVELHLVAYDIPQDIQDFAKKFNISCHVFNENTGEMI